MPDNSRVANSRYESINAETNSHNILGNIFNIFGLKGIRQHNIYIFTTFAFLFIGFIVCIPTVIVPRVKSTPDA
jgi:hypothetical protein